MQLFGKVAMPNIVNNVDLDKVSQTVTNGKKDKATLKKPVKLQGQWNFDPNNGYQFKTELSFEKGKETIEIDSPSFLGGQGNRLGPMAYCVAGITSCFIGTFVGIAAQKGITLTKLTVNTKLILQKHLMYQMSQLRKELILRLRLKAKMVIERNLKKS